MYHPSIINTIMKRNKEMDKIEIVLKEIPDYGNFIEIDTFIEWVEDGYIIDYDGYGYYATDEMMSNVEVHPSDALDGTLEHDKIFTHIVWFNR